MSDSCCYFEVASSISKEQFLATYKDIALVSQLLVAPLGVTHSTPLAEIFVEEDFAKLFRSWEEVVSRTIYAQQGIPDDRVAASMHLFLEIEKDSEVLRAISTEANRIHKVLSAPTVVELPEPVVIPEHLATLHAEAQAGEGVSRSEPWLYGSITEKVEKQTPYSGSVDAQSLGTHILELNTPAMAAALITRVLDAVEMVTPAKALPALWEHKYGMDQATKQYSEIGIARKSFQPTDVLQLKSWGDKDKGRQEEGGNLPIRAAEGLLQALQVKIPGVDDVNFSLLQYYALIDLHVDSMEVENALKSRTKIEQSSSFLCFWKSSGLPLLDLVRVGVIGTAQSQSQKLNVPGIPMSAVAKPLVSALALLSYGDIGRSSSGARSLLKLAAKQSKFRKLADRKQKGYALRAASLLDSALSKAGQCLMRALGGGAPEDTQQDDSAGDGDSMSSEDNSESEEEEEVIADKDWMDVLDGMNTRGYDEGFPIPTELHSDVLCDIAEYLCSAFEEQQMELEYRPPTQWDDPPANPMLQLAKEACDAALKLDNFCTRAFEKRATVLGCFGMHELSMGAELTEDHSDEEDNGDKDGSKKSLLRLAAKDSLASFLLGGSTDLNMAAEAEEAARQASRSAAREEFQKKVEQAEQLQSILPKAWLVRAYLAGYLSPAFAMGVTALREGLSDVEYLSYKDLTFLPSTLEPREFDHEEDVRNIDESEDMQHKCRELPIPPPELLDGNGRSHDRQAFRLLRQLCGLLEEALIEVEFRPTSQKTHSDEKGRTKLPNDSFLATRFRNKVAQRWAAEHVEVVDVQEVTCERLLQQISILGAKDDDVVPVIHSGQCKRLEAVPTKQIDAVEEAKPHNYDEEAPPCKNFLAFAELLQNPEVLVLTGVTFSSACRVENVQEVENNNEDEVWEEVDDDNDDSTASSTVSNEEIENLERDRPVSLPLRARLLNMCAIAAYLTGDASGSVSCLRASLKAQPLPVAGLHSDVPCSALAAIDAAVKLGALLCDMDNREEAGDVLHQALRAAEALQAQSSTGESCVLGASGAAAANLHIAELCIHELNYSEALSALSRANRLASRVLSICEQDSSVKRTNASAAASCIDALLPNVLSLQGVTLFRRNPTEPESALRLLRNACTEHPHATYLLLCYGEVLSQAGDLVGSLSCFEAAHGEDLHNPLPFVNAARTYQQLNQPTTSKKHLDLALRMDPTFALTHIDVAQQMLQKGKTQHALQELDRALYLSRHISDICDVLTARTVALLQAELEEEGLYCPPYQPEVEELLE